MIKIMSIGAHNDEIMADMGGTSWLLHEAGCEHLILNLACQWNSDCLTDEEKAEYRRQEEKSAEILGAEFKVIGNREDYCFLESKEAIEATINEILAYNPDIIFIHWPKDNHLEHREVAKVSYKALCVAAVRGAKFCEVYAFDTGINQSMDYFSPDFYVKINDAMPKVKESLMQYNQNSAKGPWLCAAKELKTTYRGRTFAANTNAEAFKFIKFPNKSDDILLKQLLGENFRWKSSAMYPAFGEYYFD